MADLGNGKAAGSSVGEQLRRFRQAAGLTQQVLADRSGVSQRTISELERGARRAPHPASAGMLADGLGLGDEDRAAFMSAVWRERVRTGPRERLGAAPPRPAAPMLGREQELERVAEAIGRGARLVTLVGPGGIGKTRIAVEFANSRAADTVVWTALDGLTESREVIPAVLLAAGIPERAGASPAERLAAALPDRGVLLVLDNVEHVLDVAEELAELLDAAPGLQVLATSREALRVRPEVVVPIEPLPAPTRDAGQDIAAMPSVALFFQAAGESGVPLREDVAAAGRIAAMLEGVPLAIELAAARRQILTARSIAELLEQAGLGALGQWRDGHARFRSMEAAVRWSTDLLPSGARRLLRLLSVFRGGFTVAMAGDLATRLGEPALTAALPALLDASLVRETRQASSGPGPGPGAGSGAAGELRFAMLEPIRLAALAQLAEAGEERAARDAHAAAMTDAATAASARQLGKETEAALAVFAAERANLVAALDHLVTTKQSVRALPLAAALGFWWEQTSSIREGNHWLSRTIAIDDGSAPPRSRWLARWIGALHAEQLGSLDEAHRLASEAMAIADAAADVEGQAMAGVALAVWRQAIGDLDGAIALLDTAISRVDREAYWLAGAFAHSLRATYRFYLTGETERPLEDYARSLDLYRHGSESLTGMVLVNMAGVLHAAGRRDAAVEALRRALDMRERFVQPLVQCVAALRLAVALSDTSSVVEARQSAWFLGAAQTLLAWHGYDQDQMVIADVAATQERLEPILGADLEAAVELGRQAAADGIEAFPLELASES